MTRFLISAIALFLTGCVDLTAVQNFASKSSGVMTANSAVFSGWPPIIVTHALEVARTPVIARSERAADAKELLQLANEFKGDSAVIQSAAGALQLYFTTLTSASATGVVDVSKQAASIDQSLVALKVESATGAGLAAKGSAQAIVQLLQIPLDLARQAAVRDLVVKSDKDVQTLVAYLAQVAKQAARLDYVAAGILGKYYDTSAIDSRDPGVQALVRDTGWQRQSDAQSATSQANATASALLAIGKDHAVLAANAAQLSADVVKSTLTADAPIIEAALKPFLPK
jgi:hypothetical protein